MSNNYFHKQYADWIALLVMYGCGLSILVLGTAAGGIIRMIGGGAIVIAAIYHTAGAIKANRKSSILKNVP